MRNYSKRARRESLGKDARTFEDFYYGTGKI